MPPQAIRLPAPAFLDIMRFYFRLQARDHKINGMISQDLLEILVCPACKTPLALKENGQSLKCAACRRAYPIKDNIPILLIDEAVIEPA